MGLRHPDLDWTWYVPAWRGNRARAVDGSDPTPMRVELRPPTVKDAEALADAMTAGTAARAVEVAYLRAHLRTVENFEWSDGTPIRTADDLLARRDTLDPELWRELTQAALNLARLEEGLVGKSGWGSGSAPSPPQTAGTAETAARVG